VGLLACTAAPAQLAWSSTPHSVSISGSQRLWNGVGGGQKRGVYSMLAATVVARLRSPSHLHHSKGGDVPSGAGITGTHVHSQCSAAVTLEWMMKASHGAYVVNWCRAAQGASCDNLCL
jgi:hypothetical protein